MEHDVTDELDRRLLAARPSLARVDEHAFDAALLARVRGQPIARGRTVPRAVAVPAAAGVTLTASALVMLVGVPGDVGGPSSASAITQALHWLNPPPHTILHVRNTETDGARTSTRELWQSVDDPADQRQRTEDAHTYETAADGLYDPARNTIYDTPASVGDAPAGGKAPGGRMPPGDPAVAKVRLLLQAGRMKVTGRELHNGTEAWAISLKPGFGRPVWTLWVSARDGKPLELRDPGRDASEAPQVIRWQTYEVLPSSAAHRSLTLEGAHPSARVVHDPAQVSAAERRLQPSP